VEKRHVVVVPVGMLEKGCGITPMARWMCVVVVVVVVVALDQEREAEVEVELVVVVGRARRCCRTPVFHADTPTLRMMLNEGVVVVVVVCETVSIHNHKHKNQQQQDGTVNKGIRRIVPVVPLLFWLCGTSNQGVGVYVSWSLVRSVEELSRHVLYYTYPEFDVVDEGDKRTKWWWCCSQHRLTIVVWHDGWSEGCHVEVKSIQGHEFLYDSMDPNKSDQKINYRQHPHQFGVLVSKPCVCSHHTHSRHATHNKKRLVCTCLKRSASLNFGDFDSIQNRSTLQLVRRHSSP
jgi:hypothetical protein